MRLPEALAAHEIIRELDRRSQRYHGGESSGAGPPASWQAVLRQWHHEMVLHFHPDRGGSTEVMQALNVAYERLVSLTETARRAS